MTSRTSSDGQTDQGHGHEVTLTEGNTFGFLPGPMQGVSCPNCFHDQLLRDLIGGGECRSCGATINVKLAVRAE